SHVVDLLGNGNTFLHVLELHPPGVLGDDGPGMRIPGGQRLTGPDLAVALHLQRGAVWNFVAFALAPVFILHRKLAVTRNNDLLTAHVGDIAHGRTETHDTVGLALGLA